MYKKILWKESPLKKVGFHIKKGAIPHFINKLTNNTTQENDIAKKL